MAASALPASMALPPPMAITRSRLSSRAYAAPPRISSTVGSLGTVKGAQETPAASSWAARGAARSRETPVTRRARRPMAAAAGATSRAMPSPKRMCVAVANSNRMAVLPAFVGGVDVGVSRAGARLHHHVHGHGGPSLVVRGFLMLRGRFGVAIDLDQNEARRVVRLLQDVETRNARLLHAVAGVFQGGPPERFDVLGFDVNEDVRSEEHTSEL